MLKAELRLANVDPSTRFRKFYAQERIEELSSLPQDKRLEIVQKEMGFSSKYHFQKLRDLF